MTCFSDAGMNVQRPLDPKPLPPRLLSESSPTTVTSKCVWA